MRAHTRKLLIASLPRDCLNAVRYGRDAPRCFQTIYVDPQDIKFRVRSPDPLKSDALSGNVIPGNWDRAGEMLGFVWVNMAVRSRIKEGLSWEETGAYDQMMAAISRGGGKADGCRTREDVVRRYERLDRVIGDLEAGAKFLSRRELLKGNFREYGGVVIHVGRRELFASGKGNHRLAIAQVLGLKRMAAQVGVVHPEAISNGFFRKLSVKQDAHDSSVEGTRSV